MHVPPEIPQAQRIALVRRLSHELAGELAVTVRWTSRFTRHVRKSISGITTPTSDDLSAGRPRGMETARVWNQENEPDLFLFRLVAVEAIAGDDVGLLVGTEIAEHGRFTPRCVPAARCLRRSAVVTPEWNAPSSP